MSHMSHNRGLGLARRIRDHFATRRAESRLNTLDPHLLRDIGFNPDEILGIDLHAEAARRLLGAR